MKKIALIILAVAVLLPSILWAESEVKENKPLTFIVQRNDVVVPKDGDSYGSYGLFAWWHNYGWLGLGVDLTVTPKLDYFEANPFVTVNKGPWYLNVGAVTNSSGDDYLHAGMWYFNRFNDKVEIFLDLKNLWGVRGNAADYLDAFLQIEYDVTSSLTLGGVVNYDHYWETSQPDYWAYGPIAYYDISDITKVFGRWTHDTDGTNKYRVGFEFCWK